MNTKLVGIIIIILGLTGIFGGIFFVYKQMYYKPDEVAVVDLVVEENTTEKPLENKKSYNLPIETKEGSIENIIKLKEKKIVTISGKDTSEEKNSLKENQLKRTASLFVERLGSYSNQSNFSNVADLKIYMSDKMRRWADDFIEKNNIDRDISVYYGITTKSISQKMELIDEDNGRATVLVNTLRRESGGDLVQDNSFYQEALVSFVLEDGFWKVDSANWK